MNPINSRLLVHFLVAILRVCLLVEKVKATLSFFFVLVCASFIFLMLAVLTKHCFVFVVLEIWESSHVKQFSACSFNHSS